MLRSAITTSITSQQAGDWEDGSTWVGGVAPDSHKIDVTLKHEVQVTSAEKVNNLTIFKDN